MTYPDRRQPASSWLQGASAVVVLAFDVDAESPILAEDERYAEDLSTMSHQAYGPRVGVPRILDLLRSHGIEGTFFVPGVTAERCPETVRAIAGAGHEVALHGHSHRVLPGMAEDEQRRDHVRGLYREKLDSGLSNRTVNYIHVTLHKALKQAMNDGLIPRNVTDAVKAPRPAKKEVQALDPGQVRIFLEATRGDRLEALYEVAVTTGLRQGELLGLRWTDIDLEAGKLAVRRALVAGSVGSTGPEHASTHRRTTIAAGP